MALLL